MPPRLKLRRLKLASQKEGIVAILHQMSVIHDVVIDVVTCEVVATGKVGSLVRVRHGQHVLNTGGLLPNVRSTSFLTSSYINHLLPPLMWTWNTSSWLPVEKWDRAELRQILLQTSVIHPSMGSRFQSLCLFPFSFLNNLSLPQKWDLCRHRFMNEIRNLLGMSAGQVF